jgi:hypothetical protein
MPFDPAAVSLLPCSWWSAQLDTILAPYVYTADRFVIGLEKYLSLRNLPMPWLIACFSRDLEITGYFFLVRGMFLPIRGLFYQDLFTELVAPHRMLEPFLFFSKWDVSKISHKSSLFSATRKTCRHLPDQGGWIAFPALPSITWIN